MKKENKTQTVKQAIKSVDDKKALFSKIPQTGFKGGGATKSYKLLNPSAYKGGSSQVRAIINCMIDIANSTNNPIIDNEKLLESLADCPNFETTQSPAKVVGHYRKALADVGVYELV
tara:strand:- start:84 stop:434 length:351 start_codon:yes stop_codon:yes gene_type:complete